MVLAPSARFATVVYRGPRVSRVSRHAVRAYCGFAPTLGVGASSAGTPQSLCPGPLPRSRVAGGLGRCSAGRHGLAGPCPVGWSGGMAAANGGDGLAVGPHHHHHRHGHPLSAFGLLWLGPRKGPENGCGRATPHAPSGALIGAREWEGPMCGRPGPLPLWRVAGVLGRCSAGRHGLAGPCLVGFSGGMAAAAGGDGLAVGPHHHHRCHGHPLSAFGLLWLGPRKGPENGCGRGAPGASSCALVGAKGPRGPRGCRPGLDCGWGEGAGGVALVPLPSSVHAALR